MANPGALHEWITALPQSGRYAFTRSEAERFSGGSAESVKMTLYRLQQKGWIARPRRDFLVVVPAEYRSAGSPPASWFIDDLMRHLGRRYYVALLTAAALHGAAHQKPVSFQVITDSAERDIEVGRVRIEFHTKSRLDQAAVQRMQTETGSMVVSTPETTAFDLVRYPAAAGYWNNVATVLSELAESLEGGRLAASAKRASRSDVQRLGWLLDLLDERTLADALAAALAGRRLQSTPLNCLRKAAGARLDPRWQVLVNDEVDPDL